MAGLAERLNSPSTQVMSPTAPPATRRSTFLPGETVSVPDFNDVLTIAASDATDTLDAGMTSPFLTQEREVDLFSDPVHRQAVVSGSSKTQQKR